MATGYGVNGKCVATLEQANEEFCSSFPMVNDQNTSSTTSLVRFCSANNATTITIKTQANGTAAPVSHTYTPVYSTCTIDRPTYDLTQGGVFFSTAFISVITLFLIAKSIGSVVSFIKQHTK